MRCFNTKRKILITVSVILVFIILALICSAVVCRYYISTADYSIQLEGVSSPVRVVALSDLHCREFGKGNSRLLDKIKAQSPDAIFAVGDMISNNSDISDADEMVALLCRLNEIAPTFFAPGNHELEYISRTGDDLLTKVGNAGITIVNDSYVDCNFGGQTIRIGGTMGHAFPFGRTPDEFRSSDIYRFLIEFEDTDLPTVCLAHMPDTFIFNNAASYWPGVDLVISGHTHGGMIRLSFVGGLIAPMQGFFPDYDRGYFKLSSNMQMIIGSGLAGYGIVPRIFNLPEICVIDIVPKEG